MDVQSEVGRASLGQNDVAELNISFFHCLANIFFAPMAFGTPDSSPTITIKTIACASRVY
jgi:hypothetical protein